MFKRAIEKNIGETRYKKLKKGLSIDEAKTEIVNKIVTEMNELLDDQTQGGDSTDGVITLFENILELLNISYIVCHSKSTKRFPLEYLKL